MSEPSAETIAAANRAAQRLHHLSMRYVASLIEAAQGRSVGLVPKDRPGLSEMRDLIDLVLFCRAEINALTKLLSDAGIFDAESYARQQAEEYEWFAQQKAAFLGVEVTDYGLSIKPKSP